jgi:hypothetical protein
MKYSYKNMHLYFFVIALFVISCNKKIDLLGNSKGIGVPLAKVHLTVQNILTDSLIKNENNILTLVYQKKFTTINLDTLIKLPDTLVKNVVKTTFSYTFAAGTQLYSQLIATDIKTKDLQLSRFQLTEGVIEITYLNTIKDKILMKYTIKSAVKDGQFLVINETVPAATSAGPGMLTKEYDLSNYLFDLTGPAKNSYNKLSATLGATVNPAGSGVYVSVNDSLTLLTKFKKIKPYYVRGYFGSRVVSNETNTPINIFKNASPQQLQLSKASASLAITNYTGIDAELKVKTIGTNIAPLTGTVIGKNYSLNKAIETGIGLYNVQPTLQTIEINEQNSNLVQLLKPSATEFNLSTRLSLAPLGNTSYGNDFLYGKRTIGGVFTVKIPLTFSFDNWTLRDTVKYALDSSIIDKVDNGILYFLIKNTYPVDANLTVSIIDKGTVIATLIAGKTLQGNSTTEQVLPLQLSNTQLKLLIASKKLLITTKLNSSQAPNLVTLNADAAFDVKITTQFNTHVKK